MQDTNQACERHPSGVESMRSTSTTAMLLLPSCPQGHSGCAEPESQCCVSKSCETVEKVSGNDAGGPYEDVLIGSFPLLLFSSLLCHCFHSCLHAPLAPGERLRCARNRTSRFKFWAVAAIRNCSETFHNRRSRTRRSPIRCLSSAKSASILYRARRDRS
jgi:hypothetical protein